MWGVFSTMFSIISPLPEKYIHRPGPRKNLAEPVDMVKYSPHFSVESGVRGYPGIVTKSTKNWSTGLICGAPKIDPFDTYSLSLYLWVCLNVRTIEAGLEHSHAVVAACRSNGTADGAGAQRRPGRAVDRPARKVTEQPGRRMENALKTAVCCTDCSRNTQKTKAAGPRPSPKHLHLYGLVPSMPKTVSKHKLLARTVPKTILCVTQ